MARQHQPVLAGIGRRKIITGAAVVSLAAVLGNSKLPLAAAETLTLFEETVAAHEPKPYRQRALEVSRG